MLAEIIFCGVSILGSLFASTFFMLCSLFIFWVGGGLFASFFTLIGVCFAPFTVCCPITTPIYAGCIFGGFTMGFVLLRFLMIPLTFCSFSLTLPCFLATSILCPPLFIPLLFGFSGGVCTFLGTELVMLYHCIGFGMSSLCYTIPMGWCVGLPGFIFFFVTSMFGYVFFDICIMFPSLACYLGTGAMSWIPIVCCIMPTCFTTEFSCLVSYVFCGYMTFCPFVGCQGAIAVAYAFGGAMCCPLYACSLMHIAMIFPCIAFELLCPFFWCTVPAKVVCADTVGIALGMSMCSWCAVRAGILSTCSLATCGTCPASWGLCFLCTVCSFYSCIASIPCCLFAGGSGIVGTYSLYYFLQPAGYCGPTGEVFI